MSAVKRAAPVTPTFGPPSTAIRITRASPQARKRPRTPVARAATDPGKRTWTRTAARPRFVALLANWRRIQILERLPALPLPDAFPRQYPPQRAYRCRCGVHQLPLRSQIRHAQVSAGEETVRAVLHLPRRRARAVLHALQASRQRRASCSAPIATTRTDLPLPLGGMADRPHNTEQAQANEEPCLKCHIDKRGPFVFEHAAVRIDGCETCHMPHGSTNAQAAEASGGLHAVPGVP